MTLRKILVRTPDELRSEAIDNDILRSLAEPVTDFGAELVALVNDMTDTMKAHDLCVGLAAPQIGVQKRVVLVLLKKSVTEDVEDDILIMVNPEILTTSGSKDKKRESCMSLPGWTGDVTRREKTSVLYSDIHGGTHERLFVGFQARIVSHEIEHLDGHLYADFTWESGLELQATDIFKNSNFDEVQREAVEMS